MTVTNKENLKTSLIVNKQKRAQIIYYCYNCEWNQISVYVTV